MSIASTVGSLVVISTVLAGALMAGRVADTSQRAAGAADAAALAAADTLSGRIPGTACENAADIASRNGAALVSCDAVDATATVSVSIRVMGIDVHARARAGPPPAQ